MSSKPEGTLDLLTDLLDTIHRSRQSILAARGRKYQARLERRKERAKLASRVRLGDDDDFVDETTAEADDERLLEELASQFSAPPRASVAPPSLSSSSSSSSSISSGIKPESAAIFQGNSDKGFDSATDLKYDLEAAHVFEDFRIEVQKWFGDNSLRRKDTDARGDFADYLVNKYLSKRLDPLPPSKTVTTVRRAISKIVEDVGSATDLSLDFAETAFKISGEGLGVVVGGVGSGGGEVLPGGSAAKSAATDDKNAQTIKAAALAATKAASSVAADPALKKKAAAGGAGAGGGKGPAVPAASAAPKMSDAEKREAEKQRIKEQYEGYMKLKNQTEAHPDQAKAKEYEALENDIKSLLTTLQKK